MFQSYDLAKKKTKTLFITSCQKFIIQAEPNMIHSRVRNYKSEKCMVLGTSWTSVPWELRNSHYDWFPWLADTESTESNVTESDWQSHEGKFSCLSKLVFKCCLNVTFCQELHSPLLFDIRFHIMKNGIQINLESSSLICLVLTQGTNQLQARLDLS